jgi:N-acetylneuraminic acid mutarotase
LPRIEQISEISEISEWSEWSAGKSLTPRSAYCCLTFARESQRNAPSFMTVTARLLVVVCLLHSLPVLAQVTGVVHYQGELLVWPSAFDGTGQFKFALVNSAASETFWRNAPDADNDGEPDQAVSVAVAHGLYAVSLGDAALANMAPIPLSVFSDKIGGLVSDPLYLRVWFHDGANGFQHLAPDQRISAVSFAMVAATVPDASITAAKLAPGALQAGSIAGTLASAQIPELDAAKIVSGTLDEARLPANVALKNPDLDDLAAQIASMRTRVALSSPSPGLTGQVLVSQNPAEPTFLTLGYAPFTSIAAPAWNNGTTGGVPSPRYGHAVVWAPSIGEMIVWGGQLSANTYAASGGLYRPDADQWRPVPPVNAPVARRGHTMIWDGNAAYVWGGFSESGFLNTGGRFAPGPYDWKTLATANAPEARDGHVAVWFAPFMVVWGGRNAAGLRSDGALYHTANNEWTPLTLVNAPAARSGASAVADSNRVLVWGGIGGAGVLNTGAQLVFRRAPSVPLRWTTISTVNAPSARTAHTAVMAGTRMIVWGGRNGGTLLSDGKIYNPTTDTWTELPAQGAPSPRSGHVAVWTGEEMLIFGGDGASGPTATGAAFNPAANRWRPLSSAGSPVARSGATAIWTGFELVVFGGQAGALPVGALQRLTPQPTWYLYRRL